MNVVNITNVLNVTVKKEKNTQKTVHMLEYCLLMRWALVSSPLECCECNECNECNSWKGKNTQKTMHMLESY